MKRVIAVVEGQTEATFVREVLAPHLGNSGIALTARVVGKPGHKGGVGEYSRARRDILALIKQESTTIITTMFDFYAMPDSWPGRKAAKRLRHDRKAPSVEAAIKSDIAAEFGTAWNPDRLWPYIQMHEFEALLFAKPDVLCQVMSEPDVSDDLQAIRDEFADPERINDSPNSAPSKRIEEFFARYRKPLHGVLAAKRITLEVMRSECPHFNEWLEMLEELA
jgi:hypothetical protein